MIRIRPNRRRAYRQLEALCSGRKPAAGSRPGGTLPNPGEDAERFADGETEVSEAEDESLRTRWSLGTVFTDGLDRLDALLRASGVRISPITLTAACIVSGTALVGASVPVLSTEVLPIVFILGGSIPVSLLEHRARDRGVQLIADYPTVLLAAASSLKAGLTPYQALFRATRLLPTSSAVRHEVEHLLRRIDEGEPRDRAIAKFCASYREPELDLFRRAFALALEHGGKFAPTLVRLANVSHSRASLIGAAAVSTATMRMTANVLLVIGPLLVVLMTGRSEGYWETLMEHPTANLIGSIGVLTVVTCYAILRRMSAFKP